jgi:hypothetical protein
MPKSKETPPRSGEASREFLSRDVATVDESDLDKGERRRGGQRVK